MDKVVVLMSAYNGEAYIVEQIDSIVAQKDVDVTLVVRDDGSTDATWSIIQAYKENKPDKSIELIRGNNIGYVKSFHELVVYGIKKYHDCYFAFSDHDDVWLDDKLSTAVCQLKDRHIDKSLPALYCSNAMMVNVELEEMGLFRKTTPMITPQRCLIHNIVTGCTAVFNVKAAEIFANYQISDIAVHDQYLYIICVLLGTVIYDPVPHILYRQHGRNQIGKPSLSKRLADSFKKLFQDTHSLEYRAQRIFATLNEFLPADERRIVLELAEYKQSVRKRLKLFCDLEFSYSTIRDNILFRCKILMGRV